MVGQRNDLWRPWNDDDDRRIRGGRIDGHARYCRYRDDRPRDIKEWQRREEDRGDHWYDYSRDAERHRYVDSYRPLSPAPLAYSRPNSSIPHSPIAARPPSPDEAAPPSPSTPPLPNMSPFPPDHKNQTHSGVNAAVPKKCPSQMEQFSPHNPTTLAHQSRLPLPPPPPPAQEQQSINSEFKPPEVPKSRSIKRAQLHRRTVKEEMAAYGREFVGCGVQSDYDLTTKLGEGTFGSVLFNTQLKIFFLNGTTEKSIKQSTGRMALSSP